MKIHLDDEWWISDEKTKIWLIKGHDVRGASLPFVFYKNQKMIYRCEWSKKVPKHIEALYRLYCLTQKIKL